MKFLIENLLWTKAKLIALQPGSIFLSFYQQACTAGPVHRQIAAMAAASALSQGLH